jgi:RNA polymerase sigma-70 factor (ECF subfamily)
MTAATDIREELLGLLPRLRRFSRALTRHEADADDLLQVAIERALKNMAQWQKDTSLDRWMYRIIRNAWIDEIRSRRRRGPHLDVDELADFVPGVSGDAVSDALSVQQAMERLPEDQRTAVTLVLVEGLSYKEAAEVMEVPIGTLTSRLARGREALQALLGGTMETAS